MAWSTVMIPPSSATHFSDISFWSFAISKILAALIMRFFLQEQNYNRRHPELGTVFHRRCFFPKTRKNLTISPEYPFIFSRGWKITLRDPRALPCRRAGNPHGNLRNML